MMLSLLAFCDIDAPACPVLRCLDSSFLHSCKFAHLVIGRLATEWLRSVVSCLAYQNSVAFFLIRFDSEMEKMTSDENNYKKPKMNRTKLPRNPGHTQRSNGCC